MAATQPQLLDPQEQDKWLVEHIPCRICAILPGLPMKGEWLTEAHHFHYSPHTSRFSRCCVDNAIMAGRLTAIRWLIMFVGISADKNWKPMICDLRREQTDVRIDRIHGGKLFDVTSNEATTLARIYVGCSQAMGHATTGTNHPKVEPPELAEALSLIITHLERTIYAANNRNLLKDTLAAQ